MLLYFSEDDSPRAIVSPGYDNIVLVGDEGIISKAKNFTFSSYKFSQIT